MTTPHLHRSPADHEPDSVKYHLATAMSWAETADELYDHDADPDDPADNSPAAWTALFAQATTAAALSAAHAAIAQAKIAAGWPVE